MNLKNLYADDNAVSPVIGVILMVAITVILAAVIGTFVLNLGDQMNQNAPTTNFAFDEESDTVTIEHTGGDTIPESNLNVTVNGEEANFVDEAWDGSGDGDINAGSSVTVDGADGSSTWPDTSGENTIRIIWTSDDGSTTQTLDDYTYDTS